MKQLIARIDAHATLYRDTKTGIAWIHNERNGCDYSAHPMTLPENAAYQKQGDYWLPGDRIVRSHGWAHNIDCLAIDHTYGAIAAEHCRCGGQHGAYQERSAS